MISNCGLASETDVPHFAYFSFLTSYSSPQTPAPALPPTKRPFEPSLVRPTRRHTCCIWIEVAFILIACKCITEPMTVQMAPSPGPASQEASMTNMLPNVLLVWLNKYLAWICAFAAMNVSTDLDCACMLALTVYLDLLQL